MIDPKQQTSSINEDDEEWELLWGVERSIRYHDRRRRFFEACHSIVLVFGAILAVVGFAVANEIIREQWLSAVFSILTMLVFLLYLFFAFSRCARHHISLKHKFSELEKKIITNDDKNNIATLKACRIEIEKDEPPIRRALDILCHNELARSRRETKDDIYKVTLSQRLTAQIFSWPNIQVEKENLSMK